MSVKETVHKWIDEMPDDAPRLLDLYEQARLSEAIEEGMADVRAGRVYSIEEVRQRREERRRESQCK